MYNIDFSYLFWLWENAHIVIRSLNLNNVVMRRFVGKLKISMNNKQIMRK